MHAMNRKAYHGAGNGIRTRDPNLGKVVLYQLSYSRIICHKAKSLCLLTDWPLTYHRAISYN